MRAAVGCLLPRVIEVGGNSDDSTSKGVYLRTDVNDSLEGLVGILFCSGTHLLRDDSSSDD